MTYSTTERATCPHVIHNISGRQSRLTFLDFGQHIQEKRKYTKNPAMWLAITLNKKFIYIYI